MVKNNNINKINTKPQKSSAQLLNTSLLQAVINQWLALIVRDRFSARSKDGIAEVGKD